MGAGDSKVKVAALDGSDGKAVRAANISAGIMLTPPLRYSNTVYNCYPSYSPTYWPIQFYHQRQPRHTVTSKRLAARRAEEDAVAMQEVGRRAKKLRRVLRHVARIDNYTISQHGADYCFVRCCASFAPPPPPPPHPTPFTAALFEPPEHPPHNSP